MRPVYERVPDYYRREPNSKSILDRLGEVSQAEREFLDDVIDQFYVSTATWGLSAWERVVGITTDESQTLEKRRTEIVSRMMGAGTATPAMISAVVESLTGYRTVIEEVPEEYLFRLRFTGQTSCFVYLHSAAVREVLERIKPAHLQAVIQAITWGDLEQEKLTWAQVEQQFPTWADFEQKFYINEEG